MLYHVHLRQRRVRRGATAVEFAIMLPLFLTILCLSVDFGQAFYAFITICSSARDGAVYASTTVNGSGDGTGTGNIAKADAANLVQGNLHVSLANATDSGGGTAVNVTVTYPFQTVTNYLIPDSVTLSKTVRMRVPVLVPASYPTGQTGGSS
jgi:Flp pilus assembly protein TadG